MLISYWQLHYGFIELLSCRCFDDESFASREPSDSVDLLSADKKKVERKLLFWKIDHEELSQMLVIPFLFQFRLPCSAKQQRVK